MCTRASKHVGTSVPLVCDIQIKLGADEFHCHLCAWLSLHWQLCSHQSPFTYTPLLPSDPTSPVSSSPGHDHWGGTFPPPSWARGGDTYDWRAAAPTLFVFVLNATSSMLRQERPHTRPNTLTTPLHATTLHSHLLPVTPLNPIAISILAINCLSCTCHWASPQQPLRTELPSTSTHALAKYTKEPWLYPPPPLDVPVLPNI